MNTENESGLVPLYSERSQDSVLDTGILRGGVEMAIALVTRSCNICSRSNETNPSMSSNPRKV